jgi:hypothetical protein
MMIGPLSHGMGDRSARGRHGSGSRRIMRLVTPNNNSVKTQTARPDCRHEAGSRGRRALCARAKTVNSTAHTDAQLSQLRAAAEDDPKIIGTLISGLTRTPRVGGCHSFRREP